MLIIRISNDNKNTIKSSAPCLHCLNIIKKINIKKIIFTNNVNQLEIHKVKLYETINISAGYRYIKREKLTNISNR